MLKVIDTRELLQAGLKVMGIENEEDLWSMDMEDNARLAKLVFECANTKWSFDESVDIVEEVSVLMQP